MKKINCLFIILIMLCGSANSQIVTVNDIRDFNIDENTIIKIDSAVIDPADFPFEIIGTGGYKIRFRIANDVNATMSQGTFSELNLISDINGPITNINPLKILDQKVFATGNTNFQNLTQITDLLTGDLVSISGAIYAIDNSMQLSRLEKKQELDNWKLRGYAKNVMADTFTIGDLTVNRNGVMATGCDNGFLNNTFVSIKATPDLSYFEGQPLTTLTEINCETADVDDDVNDSIPIVVEGFVSEIIDLVSFKINDLTIFIESETDIDNGEIEHLDIGTKIEVQGIIDTVNRLITADTIRFINHRIKMEAPVSTSDVVLNTSISILGNDVFFTPQTRDDDNIITQGLNENSQVEVRGFIDDNGKMFAQRIKDKGDEDEQDVSLRGDITAINQPYISINGINVDSTLSEFEVDEGLVSLEEFFDRIEVGMQISIEEASYDNQTKELSLGTIELEEEELEDDADHELEFIKTNSHREIIGTGGIGIATVTSTEMIFRSGFE